MAPAITMMELSPASLTVITATPDETPAVWADVGDVDALAGQIRVHVAPEEIVAHTAYEALRHVRRPAGQP